MTERATSVTVAQEDLRILLGIDDVSPERHDQAAIRLDAVARMTPSQEPSDRQVLDALWQIAYRSGREVRLCIRGSHVEWMAVIVGDHEFEFSKDSVRLVEWAEALRARKANAPTPEPPPKT